MALTCERDGSVRASTMNGAYSNVPTVGSYAIFVTLLPLYIDEWARLIHLSCGILTLYSAILVAYFQAVPSTRVEAHHNKSVCINQARPSLPILKFNVKVRSDTCYILSSVEHLPHYLIPKSNVHVLGVHVWHIFLSESSDIIQSDAAQCCY